MQRRKERIEMGSKKRWKKEWKKCWKVQSENLKNGTMAHIGMWKEREFVSAMCVVWEQESGGKGAGGSGDTSPRHKTENK